MQRAASVELEGTALHAGCRVRVRLSRAPGPFTFVVAGASATLAELAPVRTDRGVTLATGDGRVSIDLVEHLLAAAGGLGVSRGLRVEVDGPELPLLDGGAARFASALVELGIEGASPSPARVLRAASFQHGGSRYDFAPGGARRLAVEVDFPAPVGRQSASWDGDAEDFRGRLAPARTFGWAREAEALRAKGRAAAVDLASVLVFDDRGPIDGCHAAGADEPARHKLLDLLGDVTLHGGPPLGSIVAGRPGHTASHAIFAEARRAGVFG